MNSSPTHLVQQPKIDTTQQPAVTRYTRRVDVDDFEFIEGGNSHSFFFIIMVPPSQSKGGEHVRLRILRQRRIVITVDFYPPTTP